MQDRHRALALTRNPNAGRPHFTLPGSQLDLRKIRVSQKQGNQESRAKLREDHYTPEKFRMECIG